MKIAFFGTPSIATTALDKLKETGILPSLIISNPDTKIGRKQILTPPPTALWAKENNIKLIQPETLKGITDLTDESWDLFVVVAYGKILSQEILDLPKHGTINLHPSLLPKFRGASPIRSAILADERETGVTIMQLDAKMDHGPILAQQTVYIEPAEWPVGGLKLDEILANEGANLLAETIPHYVAGKITPTEQNHKNATFCTKITKDMSELQFDPNNLPSDREAYETLLKIRAFAGWPETFFIHDGKRIKIKSAHLSNTGTLVIDRIIPEGKKEMDFSNYFRS